MANDSVNVMPGATFCLEQVEERRLLGVIGTRRITGRRPDALVSLGDQVRVRQGLVPCIAPQLTPDAFVESLGECFSEAVGEGLGEDRRIVVVGGLELAHDRLEAVARR